MGLETKTLNGTLPSFFIVGAPKAGTTSLYHYLKQHPEVFFPEIKEPDYFSSSEILEQNLYYDTKVIADFKNYQKLYKASEGMKVRGDASVSYLFYPAVPQRIKEMIPDVRVIIMLRNPVDRAYSHYLMDRRLGVVNISFEDILMNRSGHKLRDLYYMQYIEVGLYAEQVERYLQVFGEDKVHIIFLEEFRENTLDCFKQVCSFLEISTVYEPELERHNTFALPGNKVLGWMYHFNWLRKMLRFVLPYKGKRFLENFVLSDKQKPPISPDLTNLLWNLYENDVKRLGNLLGRNLLHLWRTYD